MEGRPKVRTGKGGAPADHGDAGGDGAIVQGAKETLRSGWVLLMDRSRSGGSERSIAHFRRKIFGQATFLLLKNRIAVAVFKAVDKQGSRGVIFEKRLVVRVDLRAGREFAQTGVVEKIEAEQSSRFFHPEVREIIAKARQAVHGLSAPENFAPGRTGRHQDEIWCVAMP